MQRKTKHVIMSHDQNAGKIIIHWLLRNHFKVKPSSNIWEQQ